MIQDPINEGNLSPKELEDQFFRLNFGKPITLYHFIILFFMTALNCVVIVKSLVLMDTLFKQIAFAILLGGLLLYYGYASIRIKSSYRYSCYFIGLWGVVAIIFNFMRDGKMLFLLVVDFVFWFYFMMIIEGIMSGVPESYDKVRKWRKSVRDQIRKEAKERDRKENINLHM